jgi:hypothetical protein
MVAMARDTNPSDRGDDPADAAALAGYAQALADALVAAIPGWIERSVLGRVTQARGQVSVEEAAAAAEAGLRAGTEAEPRLRRLLAADIDDQATTPLAVARRQIRWATAALAAAEVPAVRRDPFAQRQDPDDTYDLTPASFAEIDPALAEPGLAWGAAKAHVHLARRRRAGQR